MTRPQLDFTLLFEQAPGLYLVLDTALVILDASNQFLEASKTSRKQIVGRQVFEVFPDNPFWANASGVQNLRASLERVLQYRTTDVMALQRYDIRMSDADDAEFEEHWWSPINAPIFDRDGTLKYILHRVEDATTFVQLRNPGSPCASPTEKATAAEQLECELIYRAQSIQQLNSQLIDLTEKLSAEVERYRVLSENIPQLVWSCRADGTAIYLSSTWREFTGMSEDETKGRGWLSAIHPDDLKRVVQEWQASSRNETFKTEFRARDYEGSYRWFLGQANPRLSEDDEVLEWIGTWTDIDPQLRNAQQLERNVAEGRVQLEESENKRALSDEELRQTNIELSSARDRAVESSALKSAFVANISHELRTPLSGILGMNELLLASDLDEEQRTLAFTVQESAESLLTIVNDLLDLSKIEAGKLSLEVAPFNPNFLMQDAARLLYAAAKNKGVAVHTRIDHSIPQFVCGDPQRLRQVLINLIGNALKFTNEGEINVESRLLSIDEHFIELMFTVTDTGIGFDTKKAKLFKPFVQVDNSATRKFGGTGLGLTISKTLVQMMQGKIDCESVPDKGSRFWFSARFVRDLPQNIQRTNKVLTGAESPVGGNILVVEDNAVLQSLAAKQLTNLGCFAHVVGNGKEALSAVDSFEFDLVLMDCHLPDIDGYECTRKIRRKEKGTTKHLPIIALTAGAMQGDRERCLAAGMDDYLSKPVSVKELAGKVRYWLGQVKAESNQA